MNYEELQIQNADLNMKEMDLSEVSGLKGLYYNGNIAIEKKLTQNQKACVLAEELGHHYTTVGNILDQSDPGAMKQERKARLWAYNELIGLSGIIQGYKAHCRNLAEMADYLDVTEPFLVDCLEVYRRKYGCCAELDNYVIMFEPRLAVVERF
mgnify:CR=1 FL=1